MRPLDFVVPGLKHAVIFAMVPFAAIFIAGCGTVGSGGGDDLLDMILPDTRVVGITDVATFTAGDVPESVGGDWEESGFAEMGVLESEVETSLTAANSGGRYGMVMGEFDFEFVGDTLYDDNYDDEDFRGYEVWGSRGRDVAIGLVESHGLIVAGTEGHVYTVLRNLSNEASAGGSTDIVRVMRRAGDGWVRYGEASCDESLRGCLAVSASFSTGERYEIEFKGALLFRNERAAESQREDVEEMFESNRDIVVESIVATDEFVEVRGRIDEDDFQAVYDFFDDHVGQGQ